MDDRCLDKNVATIVHKQRIGTARLLVKMHGAAVASRMLVSVLRIVESENDRHSDIVYCPDEIIADAVRWCVHQRTK